ncbi:hypothetical protein ACU4GI_03750 [Cupriavidus basilensis]|uniref:hypothetical protein n=1 Tax=Cupriavidus basilensis TaxID=68895 RepID=UPI0023E854E2|nr:hypothetical protein [Cupriavidus basilensis]MDF3882043.1 hypothetical protein [Cupriavidus basilensis]
MKLPFKDLKHLVAQDQQQYDSGRSHAEIQPDLPPARSSQAPEVTLDHDFRRWVAANANTAAFLPAGRQLTRPWFLISTATFLIVDLTGWINREATLSIQLRI